MTGGRKSELRAARLARLQGVVVVVVAFVVILLQFRYFMSSGTPEATGSIQGGWGILILIGLPWAALVAGFLMLLSGTDIRQYAAHFAALPLRARMGVALAAVVMSVLAAGLAIAVA